MAETRVLCLGDTHFPFHHKKALEWTYRLADRLKPTHVVQCGDLYDLFAFSRFPKTLKLSPEKELDLARTAAEKMWAHFKGLSCYQLFGNHDLRPIKKVLSVAPELASLVDKGIRGLYTFTDVRSILDTREELHLRVNGEDVFFQHGHRSELGAHARYNLANTVHGHTHRAGLVFERNHKRAFWELDVGFLADIRAEAFGYRAQKVIHKTVVGAGWIDELGPRFLPYQLTRK